MAIARRRGLEMAGNLAAHLLLVCAGVFFLAPLLWMLSTALKPVEQTMVVPPQWVPRPIEWGNFLSAVEYIDFFQYTANSLKVCLFSVAGTLLSSSLAAYGFSRIEWKGRDLFFMVTVSTMMVPFPILMVPLYGLFRELHWIGTLQPLWVPSFFGSAFNIFLLRQFFLGIPKELTEAAHMDGCPEWRIWAQIILPLSKPALAVAALFQFIYNWNDFLGPLLFLTRQKDFTLALGLQLFQSQNGGTQWHLLMAASLLASLPILLLFLFAQKTFIQGITMSGLKD